MKLIQTIDAECCPQVLAAPLDREEAGRLADALKVLADPARLQLLSLIGAAPEGEDASATSWSRWVCRNRP